MAGHYTMCTDSFTRLHATNNLIKLMQEKQHRRIEPANKSMYSSNYHSSSVHLIRWQANGIFESDDLIKYFFSFFDIASTDLYCFHHHKIMHQNVSFIFVFEYCQLLSLNDAGTVWQECVFVYVVDDFTNWKQDKTNGKQ